MQLQEVNGHFLRQILEFFLYGLLEPTSLMWQGWKVLSTWIFAIDLVMLRKQHETYVIKMYDTVEFACLKGTSPLFKRSLFKL